MTDLQLPQFLCVLCGLLVLEFWSRLCCPASRPACSPVPISQALRILPSSLHPQLLALGGYKVSRRAARSAEGSTQLCMASTMLRIWSPRRRLPAESGVAEGALSEWPLGSGESGPGASFTVMPCLNLSKQPNFPVPQFPCLYHAWASIILGKSCPR